MITDEGVLMKNISLVITTLVIIIAIAGVVFAYQQLGARKQMAVVNAEPTVSTEVAMVVEATQEKTQASTPNDHGTYQPFTPQLVSSTAATRRVLFFYASWCPTCQPADASFAKESNRLPANVTLIRVNFNDPETEQAEKELAEKYSVTYQHTFVQIDAQGKPISVWNGGRMDELLSHLQ